MELKEGQHLGRKELAEWFNIKEKSFSTYKERKLEELKEYCDYDLIITPKGSFKGVIIKQVYYSVYFTFHREKIQDWLNSLDRDTLINNNNVNLSKLYCEQNNIELEKGSQLARYINDTIRKRKPAFAREVSRRRPPQVKLKTNMSLEDLGRVPDSTDYSKRTYVVYRYYSKSEKKSYIGMTHNIQERKGQHESPNCWRTQSTKKLYIAMAALGLDDFIFEMLHWGLTEEEAHYWEAKEIENYDSIANGYNVRDESKYLNSGLLEG